MQMQEELRLTGPAIATVDVPVAVQLAQQFHEPVGGRGHLEYQVPGGVSWSVAQPGAAVSLDPPEFPFTSQQQVQELAPVAFHAGGKWLVRAVVQPDPEHVLEGMDPPQPPDPIVSNAILVRAVLQVPVDP